MGEVLGGRYELVDPLGEGGAGVVWRAWDHREARYVAAKVMRQADAASLLRFVREQAVRVEHPHVLTPLGWAGEDERVLFTMPIVRGGSAATLVGDHGPLSPTWVAVLLDQLLLALERIHGEGLVHRDVKPANLLLDATGRDYPRMRLADFGIATTLDQPRLTHVSHVVGTVGYAAPETFSPGWDPDPRADLFAAGMTASELLLGERPDTVGDLAVALVRAEAPVQLSALLLDLSSRDPDDRPADAAAARAALHRTGLVGEGTTWDAGEVEVFDQVPPLPPGWDEEGPAGSAGAVVSDDRARENLAAPDAEEAGDVQSPARASGAWAGPALLVLGLALILLATLIAIL
ncbi:serine/threonine-protein kinase [Ornithinimicrobium panacihumi]|uniref:serine/threonine-protein kinase n=1 Tax=Ornithinimicrobium panacihumi TaxID=2008449 RepID=UPI003F8C4CA2